MLSPCVVKKLEVKQRFGKESPHPRSAKMWQMRVNVHLEPHNRSINEDRKKKDVSLNSNAAYWGNRTPPTLWRKPYRTHAL